MKRKTRDRISLQVSIVTFFLMNYSAIVLIDVNNRFRFTRNDNTNCQLENESNAREEIKEYMLIQWLRWNERQASKKKMV